MKKLLLLIILVLCLVPIVSADTDVYLFYGDGCPHCEQLMEFLDTLDYENINIIEKEIYFDEDNRNLFFQMAEDYGVEVSGVPTVFIDGQVFVGFSDEIAEELELAISQCSINDCTDSSDIVETNSSEVVDKTVWGALTLPAVISAAAVDAINPCAFAVLVLLLTTVLGSSKKNKKKALFSGLAFSLAIFISYFLMGLGLYSAMAYSGVTKYIYLIVAILAIIIGLFNLKDYFFYGKWFKMEVPDSWRPRMKSLIRGVPSVPGAFVMGIIISLFLLPCTSGPYIVILGLLSEAATRNYATFMLFVYNLVFILPMVGITIAVYLGITTTQRAERWRVGKLKVLHLITGLIILLLGVGMLIALYLGWI